MPATGRTVAEMIAHRVGMSLGKFAPERVAVCGKLGSLSVIVASARLRHLIQRARLDPNAASRPIRGHRWIAAKCCVKA
jgi:hypothetical protein